MAMQHNQEREFRVERGALLQLTFGPLIWALHFLLAYCSVAIACAKFVGPDGSLLMLRMGLGVLTLVALAATSGLAWRAWRQWDFLDDLDHEHASGIAEDRHEFLGHAAFLLAVLSFVAIVFTGLPLLILETCR